MINYSQLTRFIIRHAVKFAAIGALIAPLATSAQYDVYRASSWDIGLRIFQQGSLDFRLMIERHCFFLFFAACLGLVDLHEKKVTFVKSSSE